MTRYGRLLLLGLTIAVVWLVVMMIRLVWYW